MRHLSIYPIELDRIIKFASKKMDITHAEFIISNTDISKCPNPDKPEYAFIGRSNVGKSSLINMLTNRKNLAMTSSKPGKTQLVNHFLINKVWYLVDLPGYGYAKTAKSIKKTFGRIIESYILRRESLTNLFVLIDSRHKPQNNDLEFMAWLGEKNIPFAIIFTKTDKLGVSKLGESIANYKKELLKNWEELPPIFMTSALKRNGAEELLNYIDEINSSLKKQ